MPNINEKKPINPSNNGISNKYGISTNSNSLANDESIVAGFLCISFCAGACSSQCSSACSTACSSSCGSACATSCSSACSTACASKCWSLCGGGGSSDVEIIIDIEEIIL